MVAVVVVLVLLGIGMVVNQLLRLKRYLRDSATEEPRGITPERPDPPIS